MIEVALYSLLSNDSAVTALVSDRIYPVIAEQGTLVPYIRYQNMDTNQDHTFDGPKTYHDSLIRVDVVAGTFFKAKELGLKVKTLLNGHSGIIGDINIQAVIFKGESDSIQDRVDEEIGLFGVTQTYAFHYSE